MKSKEYILFDLDGTLTDPAEGITNSVMYSLEKYGITVSDKTELYKFIGPPLFESYMKYYGFSKEKALEAVEFYREYFRDKGIFENSVYKGIPELLRKLNEMGKKVILATSKPEEFAKKILKHFNLEKYFYFVAGATMSETRTKKHDVISYILEKLKIDDTQNTVMIGDREMDINGAHSLNMPAVGVLYGYGSLEELQGAKAEMIANTVKELEEILI